MPLPNLAAVSDAVGVFDAKASRTRAFADFCYQGGRIVEPFTYLVTKFQWLEKTSLNAARVLRKLEKADTPEASEEIAEVGHFREFRQRVPVLAQTAIVSLVDAFETYLFDLFSEILSNNPRMLSSKKMVSLEDIFDAGDVSILIQRLVQRRAREMSYLSFRDRAQTWHKDYSFDLVDEDVLNFMERLVGLRNCFVHNRGRLDDRVSQMIGPSGQLGTKIVVQGPDVFDIAMLLNLIAKDIDERAAQKFGLSHPGKEATPSGAIEFRSAVGLPSLSPLAS